MHIRLRKILGLVFVLTAAIAAAGLLAGCGQAAYTAVFMADGEVIATVDCTDGVPVDTVPVPEKPGYTGAWGAAEWDGGRLVVTAAYTPNAYYITFKAYGDMTLDVVAYTTGDAAVEEPEVPVMYGYEGSWEPYSLAAGGNLTVRAVYTAIEYTVTYIADGQTIAVVTASAENPPAEPEVPEKSGYTGRWETSATDGYDYTMTAVYTPIQYQVTLQRNGRGWLYGGGWHGYGETVTVTAEPHGGYAFSGWYDGETLVSEEASYTFTMPQRDVTYIARFVVRADMAPFTFTAGANGCTVTGVTDPTVTQLVVPDCVTDIAFNALGSCTSLTSLTVPVSDHSLGYWFGTDQYEYNAAYVPATLTEVTVTGGTSLAYNAFRNCPSLENIILPDTLTSIGGNAFYDCERLTEITLPSGLTSIGATAFGGCTSLTEITLPSGVTEIGGGAFSGCTSLTEITIPSGVYVLEDSVFSNCTVLRQVDLPSELYSIGLNAFYECSSLTQITLPSGLTNIVKNAFHGCSSLTEIAIPAGIRVLEGGVFSGCTALRRIDLPSGLYSIDGSAFSGCSSLTEIEIPAGVMEIGSSAFSGCSSLTEINIPSGVMEIGNSVFNGCSSLTEIEIPAGVTEIGNHTFSGCTALTEITLPAGVTSIGEFAFRYCSSLTEVTIPSGVKNVGSYTFFGCTALTEITLPAGVTSIGEYAFSDCDSLTEIAIPSGVTEIGSYTFSGCSSLTEITLPSGLTSIGEYTFYDCSSLTEITLPSGLTSIGEWAFSGCSSLTAVWYGGDEAAWADVSVGTNGILLSRVYFYSPDPPAAEGNYWHYADDGVTPVAW